MLSFKFPLILIGISFIVVPLIIHLISRSRKKRLNFPAIFLFEKEIIKLSKFSKINEIILMIIRILIVILIAILLANPYFIHETENDSLTEDKINPEDKLYLILIDDTFSTQYYHQSQTLLEKMKSNAIDFVNYAEDGANFGIISFSSLLQNPYYSNKKNEIVNRITFIKPDSEIDVDIPVLMKSYIQNLNAKQYKDKYLLIYSDFQTTDWINVDLSELQNKVLVNNIDRRGYYNYSITNPSTPEILSFIGQPMDIYFTFSSYFDETMKGDIDDEIVELRIFRNDNILSEYELKPGDVGDAERKVELNLFEMGKVRVRMSLEYDRYDYDNFVYHDLYLIKNLNVYVATPGEDGLIANAVKNSIGTKYQTDTGLININTQIVPARQYDVIIVYNLSRLEQDEIDFIVNQSDNGKIIILLYSNSDNIFSLNKVIRNNLLSGISLSDKYSLSSKIKYPEGYVINNPILDLNIDKSDVFFSSMINTKVDTTLLQPLLINDKDDYILLYNNSNIFFLTADISLDYSNIIYNQVFPLLMNKLIYISIKNKLDNYNRYPTDVIEEEIPNDHIIEQGKLIYIPIKELEERLKINKELRIYNKLTELDDLFLKLKDDRNNEISDDVKNVSNFRKEKTTPLLLIILGVLLLFMLIEVLYSAIRKS